MRYSKAYLEGLLNSDDVLAVFELDAIIMSSARVDLGKPQFGLTTPSFNVHLCLSYVGEVGNGGMFNISSTNWVGMRLKQWRLCR